MLYAADCTHIDFPNSLICDFYLRTNEIGLKKVRTQKPAFRLIANRVNANKDRVMSMKINLILLKCE